jgi:hypothetical protein
MTTITSFANFTILATTPVTEEVAIRVLPLGSSAAGTGRLVHPTLGTLDYPYSPDQWEGFDTDLIVPPIWASTTTLTGAANTLWGGSIQDVQPVEHWNSDISMPMEFVRMLVNFWMNPPAPEDSYVVWSPSYANDLSYNVILTSVGSAGGELSLNYVSRKGWLQGELVLKMRVVSRA